MRALATLSLCLVATSTSGCFDPDFGAGGFRCATNKQCPDGYQCEAQPHPTEPGATIFECRVEGTKAPATLSVTVTPLKVQKGGTVDVLIDVKNFVIAADSVDKAKVDGSGHVHAFLDSSTSDKGKYIDRLITAKAQLTLPGDVTPGAHALVFSLAHNDHDLVDPPVEFAVPITILP